MLWALELVKHFIVATEHVGLRYDYATISNDINADHKPHQPAN